MASYYRYMGFSDIGASEWFVARRSEQTDAHHGDPLVRVAQSRCVALPQGDVLLATTSMEGAALAGAIAALRKAPTRWVGISWRSEGVVEQPTAIVETVVLGDGLRAALRQRFPDAVILDGAGDICAEPVGYGRAA